MSGKEKIKTRLPRFVDYAMKIRENHKSHYVCAADSIRRQTGVMQARRIPPSSEELEGIVHEHRFCARQPSPLQIE